MTEPLFQAQRVCCVCGSSALHNQKQFPAGQPVILAINLTIYRRTPRSGRQLATAKNVRCCETCTIKAVTNPSCPEGQRLAGAIFSALGDRYSAMVEAKTA